MVAKFSVVEVSLCCCMTWGPVQGDAPRLQQVRDCEQDAKDDANSSDNDVCDAQEGITTTHHCSSTEDDGLGALILGRGEPCIRWLATGYALSLGGWAHSW